MQPIIAVMLQNKRSDIGVESEAREEQYFHKYSLTAALTLQ